MTPVKVLFVCMGNICRSPTAHGIFQKLVINAGLEQVIAVDSAGTINFHAGESPDKRAAMTAREHGVDLGAIRARQVRDDDFETQDYILAMDFDNLRNLQNICPEAYRSKLQLLLDYHPDEFLEQVPDPYYGGDSGFEQVYDMVNKACLGLLKHIQQMNLKS